MKIKITTNRLPHKYPQGEIYEVEDLEGALFALVQQGEAIIESEEEYKKPVTTMGTVHATAETMEKALTRDEIKTELKEKGIEFKGNAKTEVLRDLLK